MVAYAIEQSMLPTVCSSGDDERAAKVCCIEYRTDYSTDASTASTASSTVSLNSSIDEINDEEQQFHEALTIARRRFGPDNSQVCDIRLGLAAMHRNRGNYVEALSHLEYVLESTKVQNGENHVSVAGVLLNIANVHRQSGVFREALLKFEEALKIFEAAGLPKRDRNVARVLRIVKRVEAETNSV
mmetsp:Transcript_17642/g.27467  ORF Transcript_17642/g.27467 Transcript_17642/m.27467 type:complete len:186 (-) Transcript_17642:82-639(-)